MTPLTKRVQRRCVITKDAGRRIVVAIEPDDIIAFRLERGKRWFRCPVAAAYMFTVKRELASKNRR